ncbi:MAG: N-acetylmuramoyl-L-alanine amidase, partial [Candidatus Limnocylindria bacterium]
MRRRLFLAGLVAAFVLALLPQLQAPGVAALRASGKTVANQVDHSMPAFTVGELRRDTGERIDATDAGTTGETLSVTSPVIDAGQLFERVGVHYRAAWGAEDSLLVEVRTSSTGATWGEWHLYHPEEDLADLATNTWYIAPQVAPQDSRFAQYRVWLTAGDPAALEHIALTFLDVNDLNAGPVARLGNDVGGALQDIARAYFGDGRGYAMAAPTGASSLLTRQDWGADEAIGRWTPRYVPWQKAVVHHTVTSDGGSNVAAELRAIYYFHAVTRGWGDIGYQYLVDKYGNIYEGRFGGDHVVAGHAYGWNDGSFGVAAIGDYSVHSPTSAMQGAIANVIALKFKQLGIAPFGSGAFTHTETARGGSLVDVTTVVPNILGHRDCTDTVGSGGAATACPGGRIYSMMDGIRRLAQNAWEQGYTYLTKIDPQLTPAGFPGQIQEVPVLIANRGTETIPAGTRVNYRVLREGSLVTEGAAATLERSIAPGATGNVVVPFIAPPKGEYIVRWGLQTGSAWWSRIYNDPVRDQWFRSADWSADWRSSDVPRTWTAGQDRLVTVTIRNDGGRVWTATGSNPVKVGHYWISTATRNRFEGEDLMSLPHDIQPGQSVTMRLPVSAPVYPTNYALVLDLYKENEFWFKDKGLRPDDTEVTVGLDWKAKYLLPTELPAFESEKTVRVPVTITNTGLGTFPVTSAYPVALGYHWYDDAGRTVVWEGLRTKLPADLAAGKSVTLDAQVQAPPEGGDYRLRFDLVQEGVGWFSGQGVPMDSTLVSVAGPVIPVYAVAYEPGVTTLARSGSLTALPFTLRNESNFTWKAAGADPVTLSYHWLGSDGRVAVWEGLRTRLPQDVRPGESVTVQAQVAIPVAQGAYLLRWDLVHEGVTWFSAQGARPLDQAVVVGPPPSYGGSLDVSAVPTEAAAGGVIAAPLRLQNLSDFVWDPLVNLSYHWYDADGRNVVWEGMRTP